MDEDEVREPAVPAAPVTPELREELAGYGVRLRPELQPVGTEDDRHGGLQAVLARTLEHYGLPQHVGLTGLLRHLEETRVMNENTMRVTIENQGRLVVFMDNEIVTLQARIAELEDPS